MSPLKACISQLRESLPSTQLQENRGKPLPQFANGKAPAAWKSLLDQMYALAGNGKRRVQEIEAFVPQLGYQPLRIALIGNSKFDVYAAPKDDELELPTLAGLPIYAHWSTWCVSPTT